MDLVDVDPRNGGDSAALDGSMPTAYGTASTPSDGTHTFIKSIGERSKDKVLPGIDVKAGDADGRGRGFAFIAPTVKLSKTTGELRPYRWVMPFDAVAMQEAEDDDSGTELAALIRKSRGDKAPATPGVDNSADEHTGPISGGGRHAALVSYAGRLRHRNLSYPEAEKLFRARWEECEQPPKAQHPYAWEEAQATLRDIFGRYASGERYANTPGHESETAEESPVLLRRLKLTPASAIEPEPVIWAWEPELRQGRIPAGALTLAAGREGTGKSSFGIWLAAQLSQGTLPGMFYGQPKNVLYAAVEDSWSRTLVPRLMAARADLDRIFRVDVENVLSGEETMVSLPLDVDLIEQAIRERDVAALIVDPLMSTLGRTTDAHRTQDVRQALEPLVRMAERTKALTLGIAHFNKTSGTDAAQLISGSGAFKDLARAVLVFARDRESEDQVMTQVKNSLGRLDLPHIGYVIDGMDVETPTGTANVGCLMFTGPVEMGVEDMLSSATGVDTGERDEAAQWLVTFLSDPKNGGECAATELLKAGDRDGFSKDVLKRAKKRAGVASQKAGGTGVGWVWALKRPDTESDEDSSKEAKGAKGAPFHDRAPFPPFEGNALPSPPQPERQSLNATTSQGIETGPCTGCRTPTRRYGAGGHPLCENCRNATEENES
ncbi:AAA family ATPase [Streptomyces sp. NPDC101776]|uniref:AAA family ATPase n=1 Tax=Streptomyces sp. NPDC101776 TaxID=3366146 RepID=UPI0037FD6D8A